MIIMYASFAVVLIALVLYITLRRSDRMQYKLPDLPEVSVEEIDSIQIQSKTDGELKLSKSGSSWLIEPEGYKADDSAVQAMLDAVSNLTITDLVSTSGYYDKYELDKENKMVINALNEDEVIASFDLGKRAPSYNHTYISVGDGKVYHAATDLRRVFEKDVDSLRDKKVMSFLKEEIVRIEAVLPGSTITLTKDTPAVGSGTESSSLSATWKSASGDVWETEVIDEFLGRVDDLSCSEFIDTPGPQEEPLLSLTLQGREQYTLELLAEEETGYRARSSQTPYEFYISAWQGENILETFTLEESGE